MSSPAPRPDGHEFPSVASSLTPGRTAGTPAAVMRSAAHDFTDLPLEVIAGALPADLRGHAFIAGPRVHAGTPALSSNGVVYRVDFGEGPRATLSSSALRTASHYVRRAVNDLGYLRRLFADHRLAAFRPVGLGQFSVTLGAQELPNTAPVLFPKSGRLVITTDAGRPWQIDPSSLRALSPIGYLREWRRALPLPWMLPLLQTTAHATVDPHTDELFITNHAPADPALPPFTQLCRWTEADPRVRHWQLRDPQGAPVAVQTAHQLVVTRHHVVILDSDFPVNLLGAMGSLFHPWLPLPAVTLERLTAKETSPVARVWVVAKADLIACAENLSPENPPEVTARPFVLGPGSLHIAARYEEEDETIVLVASHTPSEDLTHVLRTGERTLDGGTVPAELDGMLTPVPLVRGSIGIHALDLRDGNVDSRFHANDRYTWGIAVFTHAGLFPGELAAARGLAGPPAVAGDATPTAEVFAADRRAYDNLWFNAGGFTPDLVSESLYELYKDRAGPRSVLPQKPIPASVFRFQCSTRDFDGFSLPPGWYGFAPTFIPSAKPGVAAEDGYLLLTVVSDPGPGLPGESSGDEIWIFEALNLARGPICRLGHPSLRFGMTLHSMWTATLREAPRAGRVSMREDLPIDAIRQRYLDFLGAGLPAPWREMLAPLRALARYVLDFGDLERMLELEVFPYFDPPPRSSSTMRADETTAGTPGPGCVPSPTR